MAIGDTTKIKLRKSLTTTPGDSAITNAGADYTTEILNIVAHLQNASSTARKVTVYVGGTAAGNEVSAIDLAPVTQHSVILGKQDISIILTGTEAIYFAVDAGTDVNIYVAALQEQIA